MHRILFDESRTSRVQRSFYYTKVCGEPEKPQEKPLKPLCSSEISEHPGG